MKFRKRPIVIDAIQWTGENIKEMREFTKGKAIIDEGIGSSEDGHGYPQHYVRMVIPTLEGDHLASIGDFIIKGVEQEIYPCKKEIFFKTYEKVEE